MKSDKNENTTALIVAVIIHVAILIITLVILLTTMALINALGRMEVANNNGKCT